MGLDPRKWRQLPMSNGVDVDAEPVGVLAVSAGTGNKSIAIIPIPEL